MATVSEQIQQIYIGLLGRAADQAGLDYWAAEINGGALTLEQLRANIVNEQPEYAAGQGSMTRAQAVADLYENLFNRQPEAAGLEYWVNGGGASVNIDQLVLALIAGASAADQLVLDNKTEVAEYYTAAAGADYTADAAKAAVDNVDATRGSVDAAKVAIDSGTVASGQTFTLTTGTDTFTGTSGNDTFNAEVAVVINPAGVASNVETAQNVDTLNGGAGIDTLNLTAKGGAVTLPSLTSVEVINAGSLGALTIDTSTVSDVTNLNVTKAAGVVAATAAATTDVSVAMKAAGATVGVVGGNNVTVKLTDVAAAADVVTIGAGTAPKGDVVVEMTGKKTTANTDATLSAVNVTGGKTISVTQKATSDASAAAADKAGATITQGAITVTGNADTTTVTVKQDATVAETLATDKTGGVTATASAKFSALTTGQTIIMGGLTFTAPNGMTAAEAAAAFANLVNNAAFAVPASILAGDTQSGGAASKGTYTNVFSGWTSAAAVGDTVVFTSTTANAVVAPLANTGTGTVTITNAAGKAHDAGASGGVLGVTAGAVSVTDANATIKTITVDGVGTGSTTTATSVLETLNVSNQAAAATFVVADSAATLALNLEKVGTAAGDAVLTITSAPATLNVKSTGNNYVNLTAALTETLNVTGTGTLKADGTDLAALKTVKVSEAAGLSLNAGVANTVTSVDTTGTTGAVTVTIEGARATYTGGAGVDTVTLATDTALTKAIDLGAGDDTLIFGVAVTGSTAALKGGDGTDTLSMAVATAAALDGAPVSFYSGFERLTLNDKVDLGTADVTIDLANLGFTNYVTTSGTDDTDNGANNKLILDKMASGGTVVLAGSMDNSSAGIQVNVKDAATGTTDVLNVVLSSAGDLAAGVLTAAEVETVNISTVDTQVAPQTKNVDSLTLTADKATSVNLTGAADLTLTLTGSTKVTSIDGSTMTGGLTVTSLNTTAATTIKGGSGADVLTAATGTTADVLLGGAGNDVLVSNAGLTTLTGGEGADVFRIATASLNVNSYSTVTDFVAGDLLQIAGIGSFAAAKVTLGETAVFQDYANAAINTLAANGAGWFQFGGNTYVVADMGVDGATFTNSEDFIVKLTGLVDLTNASFNNTYDTIAL